MHNIVSVGCIAVLKCVQMIGGSFSEMWTAMYFKHVTVQHVKASVYIFFELFSRHFLWC